MTSNKDDLLWQMVALMEMGLLGENRAFPWITHKHYTKWSKRINNG